MTPVGSALGVAMIESVVATPDALTVTADAQVPDEMPPVPIAAVPLAIVEVVPADENAHAEPVQFK